MSKSSLITGSSTVNDTMGTIRREALGMMEIGDRVGPGAAEA
jgi:hypothetical protein